MSDLFLIPGLLFTALLGASFVVGIMFGIACLLRLAWLVWVGLIKSITMALKRNYDV